MAAAHSAVWPKPPSEATEKKAEPDLESNQDLHHSTADSESLPANVSIIEEDDIEQNGGQPPARSHSKEAEIARQEAAQTAVALKKLPDEESPLFWSRWKKVIVKYAHTLQIAMR